jgi:hypothetical protein
MGADLARLIEAERPAPDPDMIVTDDGETWIWNRGWKRVSAQEPMPRPLWSNFGEPSRAPNPNKVR